MRHAFTMFGFCLLLPQAAQACMPLYASSGTENLVSTLSWMLGLIYLGYTPYAFIKVRRMPATAAGYARAVRMKSLSWKLALFFIALPFFNAADAVLVTLVLFIASYVLLWTLCMTVKLAFKALKSIFNRTPPTEPEEWVTAQADYKHFNKTVGKKGFLTRRLAAVGDVQ